MICFVSALAVLLITQPTLNSAKRDDESSSYDDDDDCVPSPLFTGLSPDRQFLVGSCDLLSGWLGDHKILLDWSVLVGGLWTLFNILSV
jgi:hypothetical protein